MAVRPVRSWLPRMRSEGTVCAARSSSPSAGPPGRGALNPLSLGRSTRGDHLLPGASMFELGDAPSREECWRELAPTVTSRVLEIAGPVLGWSAFVCRKGGVGAVVMGRHALAVAEPAERAGPDGPKATHRVVNYRFDEKSLLHAQVAHTPGQVFVVASDRAYPAGLGVGEAAATQVPLPGELDEQTVRVIDSMPPRARELLTVPMAASGDDVLRHHCFWQGSSPAALDVVFVVLASARRVTAAVGARCIPPGGDPSTAHWALDCWHGDVVGRRGR